MQYGVQAPLKVFSKSSNAFYHTEIVELHRDHLQKRSLALRSFIFPVLDPAIYNEFSAAAWIGKVSTEYNL